MERAISDELARKILRDKIRQLSVQIEGLPDFLAEDLKAEHEMYIRQLREISEGQEGEV